MSASLPLFFGPSERPLFGVYHPTPEASPRAGVVICPPFGHEYIRSHRALRMLAEAVSREGFAALRFDYFGTGDSFGERTDVTLEQWSQDVHAAVDEIRDMASVERVSTVGLRLGAPIALGPNGGVGLDRMVFWDPVVNGTTYIEELAMLHDAFMETHHPPLPYWDGFRGGREILGQPIFSTFADDLRRVDLLRAEIPTDHRVTIVASEMRDEYDALHQHLVDAGVSATLDHVPGGGRWSDVNFIGDAMVATAAIRHIAKSLADG